MTPAPSSLKRVINATGVIVHTNLGRAPLGRKVAQRLQEIAEGYSNLEYDLEQGQRGNRQRLLKELLCSLTGAEDFLVTNNNAAALLLILKTMAVGREVIVSRGELIEIGDSFRLPQVMTGSGARLVEVGSVNHTRPTDYAGAITKDTAMLFKAHTSNFEVTGSSSSVSIEQLVKLGREHDLPVVYDLGSGMLRRPAGLSLENEETVQEAIAAGADLVTFSGDKLLGGPQAGLIAGKTKLIKLLAQAPIMRALRPGKLTFAALEAVVTSYRDDQRLIEENPVFNRLARSTEDLLALAGKLSTLLTAGGIEYRTVESPGQIGGGALPGKLLPGWAVEIAAPGSSRRERQKYAERTFKALQQQRPAVLGVLREGRLLFDTRALAEDDVPLLAEAIINVAGQLTAGG